VRAYATLLHLLQVEQYLASFFVLPSRYWTGYSRTSSTVQFIGQSNAVPTQPGISRDAGSTYSHWHYTVSNPAAAALVLPPLSLLWQMVLDNGRRCSAMFSHTAV
jgi:hypothetical protein